MAVIRFRSRHLHATFYDDIKVNLAALGWSSAPANFGTQPITVLDYQPDERSAPVALNTVAISLGDFNDDEDEELGARGGGLRSAMYSVFVDVYMAEQALSLAICDDVRDIYTDRTLALIDQITETVVVDTLIEVENIIGPERPPNAASAEQFKRYWRIMRLDARLYYQT